MDIEVGFGIGLVLGGLLLGLRHGIDWDHIAAITDIAATTDTPRRGAWLGSLYMLGHAAVVAGLGTIAILLGKTLPEWLDPLMGRVVGVTLLALGAYVLYALLRYRGEFRVRSRWMLIFAGVRAGYRWVRRLGTRADGAGVVHRHEHLAVARSHHMDAEVTPANPQTRWRGPTHIHPHSHHTAEEPFANYGNATSIGVGMLHGVGAETPTQVLVFLAAASAGGIAAGMAVLTAFLAGLIVSNSVITTVSAYGLRASRRRRRFHAVLGAATAAVSLVVGALFLLGHDAVLPAFFAG